MLVMAKENFVFSKKTLFTESLLSPGCAEENNPGGGRNKSDGGGVASPNEKRILPLALRVRYLAQCK